MEDKDRVEPLVQGPTPETIPEIILVPELEMLISVGFQNDSVDLSFLDDWASFFDIIFVEVDIGSEILELDHSSEHGSLLAQPLVHFLEFIVDTGKKTLFNGGD